MGYLLFFGLGLVFPVVVLWINSISDGKDYCFYTPSRDVRRSYKIFGFVRDCLVDGLACAEVVSVWVTFSGDYLVTRIDEIGAVMCRERISREAAAAFVDAYAPAALKADLLRDWFPTKS